MILVDPKADLGDRPQLVMANPYWGFAQAIGWLHPEPEPEWSAEPVHPTAQVGPGCRIAPGATVGARTVVGAGARIHPGRAHRRGLRAGRGLRAVPGGGAVPQDPSWAQRVRIHGNAVLGSDGYGYVPVAGRHEKIPQAGWVEVGDDVEIGACTTVDRGVLGPTRIQAGHQGGQPVPDRPQRADGRALPDRLPDRDLRQHHPGRPRDPGRQGGHRRPHPHRQQHRGLGQLHDRQGRPRRQLRLRLPGPAPPPVDGVPGRPEPPARDPEGPARPRQASDAGAAHLRRLGDAARGHGLRGAPGRTAGPDPGTAARGPRRAGTRPCRIRPGPGGLLGRIAWTCTCSPRPW